MQHQDGLGSQRRTIRVLRVPADDGRCEVLILRPTAGALSDAIGGGLLQETRWGTPRGGAINIYQDDDGDTKGLAPNRRAAELVARLAHGQPGDRDWRGDLLVTGANAKGDDVDVPPGVLAAAAVCGLLSSTDSAPTAHPAIRVPRTDGAWHCPLLSTFPIPAVAHDSPA